MMIHYLKRHYYERHKLALELLDRCVQQISPQSRLQVPSFQRSGAQSQGASMLRKQLQTPAKQHDIHASPGHRILLVCSKVGYLLPYSGYGIQTDATENMMS
jgi:hypothetical protein